MVFLSFFHYLKEESDNKERHLAEKQIVISVSLSVFQQNANVNYKRRSSINKVPEFPLSLIPDKLKLLNLLTFHDPNVNDDLIHFNLKR